ncbi:MAG: D-glycero-beta-D-manno-heptose 1-phosphate adenylyltransferase [Burkholderiaceae bacterium]
MSYRPDFENKIVTCEHLPAAVQQLARPLVATNGVFDILHRGHVTYLAQARALGASLVVALNSDASARKLGKGKDRPINHHDDRAALLAALQCVDLVTLFDDPVPLQVLETIRPDIYVKGGDYKIESLPEAEAVRLWGGRTIVIPFVHERSTTDLLARVRASGC